MVRLFAALILTSGPLWAEEPQFIESGNSLLAACKETDPSYCYGFVVGVLDAASFSDGPIRGWKYCMPSSVTKGQVKDLVVLWLEENPSQRHFNASYCVLRAMREAFPCN